MDKGMKKKLEVKRPKRRQYWQVSWLMPNGTMHTVGVNTGLAAIEQSARCVNLGALSITVVRGRL